MQAPRTTKPPLTPATGEFGRRVRKQREELGLSQESLAERTSLHWSYIGQIERGQSNLTLHNLLRVAAGLGVDPGDLVAGLKPPGSDKSPPGDDD